VSRVAQVGAVTPASLRRGRMYALITEREFVPVALPRTIRTSEQPFEETAVVAAAAKA
jgi:hypothetical protein